MIGRLSNNGRSRSFLNSGGEIDDQVAGEEKVQVDAHLTHGAKVRTRKACNDRGEEKIESSADLITQRVQLRHKSV